MSSYCYSPLPEGSIRLLRLMPHQDWHFPIQCHIFDCPLSDVGSTHLYEALSYTWGTEDNLRSIRLNNCDLPVGANLHAALSHLRDRYIERVIWIDAICINQRDLNEKGRQVQSMAKIYANANRVVVWLGEAAANSDQALEDIRIAAAKRPTKSSASETNQQAILTLLQRSWFQRIWVLQEVAAARYVLIKCGYTDIDGYVFCSGISALELSYEACPGLQVLIRSATYLIRAAIFRPKCVTSQLDRFSLDIRPLSVLVEMYYTRKATESHDKVYALLGMSSDDPTVAGLSVDYGISWGQLFQQLVNFLLSERVSVDTWDNKEVAVIQGKGSVLGKVYGVDNDINWEDRDNVDIIWKDAPYSFPINKRWKWRSCWTLQASARSVQVGDLVCLLQGAFRPTILRLCNDYWAVVRIAVYPTDDSPGTRIDIKRSKRTESITTFPNDFLLVWDWDMSPVQSQDGEDYEYVMNNRLGRCSKTELETHLDKAIRLGNVGLVLQDMERYEEAGESVRKAMDSFEKALRSKDSLESTSPGHFHWGKGDVKKRETMVELLIKGNGGWTPLCLAAEKGQEAIAKLLLNIDKVDPNAKDKDGLTPLCRAAKEGHETIVKLLINTGNIDPNAQNQFGEAPLSWAVKNGHEAVGRPGRSSPVWGYAAVVGSMAWA
ncbi:heterokaryon incompatibility protein-domain-containing protein [Xylariaceae sp. AK1471]|nr:heterokaryon incompatibility protein-domain-containing protein [Xylariaceae sp. AK1471]